MNELLRNLVVREQFFLASEEFGFEVMMPYCLDKQNGLYAFGYMPEYGSKNGTVIGLLDKNLNPDRGIEKWCRENKYFCSFLNIEPLMGEYKRSYFRELLRDWRL